MTYEHNAQRPQKDRESDEDPLVRNIVPCFYSYLQRQGIVVILYP